MNNAGIGLPSKSWEGIDAWRKTFDVNVFGCVVQTHTSLRQRRLILCDVSHAEVYSMYNRRSYRR